VGDQSGATMMRITLNAAIKIIERIGPATVRELAIELNSDPKRMRKAVDDWQKKGFMTHDSSKPARYFFRPLEDIGRDEIGKLSKPIKRDPTEEEIWGPGGLAEQEQRKRPEQPIRVDAVDVKLIMMPPGIGKLLGMQ
jgi:hypothetical protein